MKTARLHVNATYSDPDIRPLDSSEIVNIFIRMPDNKVVNLLDIGIEYVLLKKKLDDFFKCWIKVSLKSGLLYF